ncbi:MAG: glycosyltransferase family 4 protein [bacterium]|nr:glycosyltransferase family 4 protein [bacterium]
MRVLYLAPIRLPTEKAHGIQIMETCAALTRAGADVELVIPNRETHIKENAFDYYSIKERFPITRLRVPDTVSYGRFGFLFYAVIFAIRAALYAHRAKTDFVYTRDPTTLSVCAMLGVGPLAWEVHTAHPGVPKFITRRVSALIPITRGLADWYKSRGAPAGDIHVAPDAVDLSIFKAIKDRQKERLALRARLGVPAGAKIALYIGSFGLYAWKGVDIARKAAEYAPDVIWLFVGGTEKECAELTRGAPTQVKTLPRARREEIAGLLCAADVLLLPNKSGDTASERDTSPMKLFEYMASGVPIVSSDVPSLREVLNERNAFLVRPNDPKALAEKVRHVLASGQEAGRRAGEARADVEAYTWDKRAEGMLNFLKLHVKTI